MSKPFFGRAFFCPWGPIWGPLVNFRSAILGFGDHLGDHFLLGCFRMSTMVSVEILSRLINSFPKVVLINRVVPVKHFPCRMPGDAHYDRLGNAGLSHVRIEGVPQIVKGESVFDFPAVWNTRIPTGDLKTFAYIPDRFSPVQENMVVMNLLGQHPQYVV